jgi:hypothetical protein
MGVVKKTGGSLAKVSWKVTQGLAKATAYVGKEAWQHREEIGQGLRHAAAGGAGAVVTAAKTVHDATSLITCSKDKIRVKEFEIGDQSEKYRSLVERNEALIDSGIIGGILVADMLTGKTKVPKDIESAFEKAYPGLAQDHTFTEAVSNYESPEELQGFLSSVKGKLFEMKYVEDLNSGMLPKDYTALLADSPTQPGWDIEIRGPDESLEQVFQLKATDSLNYVQEAIEKYPDIDIVTTSELESQIAMNAAGLGEVETVVSNIANEELAAAVGEAASGGIDNIDIPDVEFPVICLALIAFSSYSNKDVNTYKKTYTFAKRGTKSMIAYFAGATAAGIAGIWWVAPPIAVGSRFLTERGRKRRETLSRLTRIYKANNKIIGRYERLQGRLSLS